MEVYSTAVLSADRPPNAIEGARRLGADLEARPLQELSIRQSSVTIGNFDGIHRGHRLLFSRALELSESLGGPAVALTFAPHPARFFRPDGAPALIDAPRQKLARLAAAGFAATVVLPFDRDLAEMTPLGFAERILRERLGARHVVVGRTFVFGHRRAGDLETLTNLGRELGFVAHGVEPLGDGPQVISSSRVREAIASGDMRSAARWLERPPTLVGVVGTGAGRGRTIGIPTANLAPENELVPANGVYAGYARLLDASTLTEEGARRWPAVTNIGHAPTFERDREVKVEAHLLGFSGDIVGQELELTLERRLRPEQRFTSKEALIRQIHHDIEGARSSLFDRQD